MPTPRLNLRFFDTDAVIESNANGMMAELQVLYQRFLIADPLLRATHRRYRLVQDVNGSATLDMDGTVHRLVSRRRAAPYLQDKIIHDVMSHIRSHLFLHAGAVATDDAGVILVADSMHGKTTLTLALAQSGLAYYSDDTAALAVDDNLLHAFPRTVSIRTKTFQLLNLEHIAPNHAADRTFVDIDRIRPNAVGDPVPPRFLFLLLDESKDHRATGHFMVITDGYTQGWVDKIRGSTTFERVEEIEHESMACLEVWSRSPSIAWRELETTALQHNVLLLDVIHDKPEPADFDRKPEVRPIPTSTAVLHLLKHFQGGMQMRLLHEQFNGSGTRLFAALTGRLSDVQCFQLSVGHLQQTVDLVRKTVGA